MNPLMLFAVIVGLSMTLLYLSLGLIDALTARDDRRDRRVSYRTLERVNRDHPHGD